MENTYKIIIKNSCNSIVYSKLYNAKTENDALKLLLNENYDVIIYSGDKIEIEEV